MPALVREQTSAQRADALRRLLSELSAQGPDMLRSMEWGEKIAEILGGLAKLEKSQGAAMDRVLAAVQQAIGGIKLPEIPEPDLSGVDASVGAIRADLQRIAKEAAAARDTLRTVIKETSDEIEDALERYVDERMSDVVRAIIELRAEMKQASAPKPKVTYSLQNVKRQDGKIVSADFVPK